MKKRLVLFLFCLILISSFCYASQLKVTEEHPFLINNSWIEASQLQVGDLLKTIDGKKAIITSIEDVEENVSVYNLEDSYYHNYIADRVIVHNSASKTGKAVGTVIAEPSTECNAFCATCARNGFGKGFMSLEKWNLFLNRIAEWVDGAKSVDLQVSMAGRGEPTLNPVFNAILDSIRRFQSEHPNSGVRFSMVTNGQEMYINPATTPARHTTINFDNLPIHVKFSMVSSNPKTYAEFHRGLNQQTVVSNIQTYLGKYKAEIISGNKQVSIHIPPSHAAVGDFLGSQGTYQFILDNLCGGDMELFNKVNVVFLPFSNRAGALSGTYALPTLADTKLIQYWARTYRNVKYGEVGLPQSLVGNLKLAVMARFAKDTKDITCPGSESVWSVTQEGVMKVCNSDWCDTLPIGNLEENSFNTLNGIRANLYKSRGENGFPGVCDKCNLPQTIKDDIVRLILSRVYKAVNPFEKSSIEPNVEVDCSLK